jgi:hypothetical protein
MAVEPVHGQKVTLGSGGALDLGESMTTLATQVSTILSKRHRGRITILPLRESDEPSTGLGALLADQLETMLAADGIVEGVTRTDLDEHIGQLTSNAFGLIDSTWAKRIGSAAGVDAIITGTVTILPSEVVIQCRIIDTVSGTPVANRQTPAVRDHEAAQDLDSSPAGLRASVTPSVNATNRSPGLRSSAAS